MDRAWTELRGAEVHDERGRWRVRDLVVDLSGGQACPDVTGVVLGHRLGRSRVLRGVRLEPRPDGDGFDLAAGPAPGPAPGRAAGQARAETEVLVEHDLLDAPVVVPDPVRRTRVADVLVHLGTEATSVVGLDLAPDTTLRRLIGRERSTTSDEVVPLSTAHLLSPRAHRAQLRDQDSWVLTRDPEELAHVLTRLPVHLAREVVKAVDPVIADQAVRRLHPHVRGRVSGQVPPRRRLRRLGGWRLHRPTTPTTSRTTRR